jgi:hypothetical protein
MSGRKHSRRRGSSLEEFEEHELKSGVILVGRRRDEEVYPRQSEPTMQSIGVLLVAVERGAALPVWVGRCQDRVSDVVLLISNSDESAAAMTKRIEQRAHLLTGSDHQRGVAVLVVDISQLTADATRARREIADCLLAYLTHVGEGVLLLLAEESATLESRSELLSMAGALAQKVRGTRISISLHFGKASEAEPPKGLLEVAESGTRRTSRRPPPQSGEMPKAPILPHLHKASSLPPRRRLRSTG